MSFTYDISTTLGRTRFLIQDTVQARALLTDEEINSQLAMYAQPPTPSTPYLCAADLCLILTARFGQEVTRSVGKVSESFSDRVKFFSDLEKRYRAVLIGEATTWVGGVERADFDANNQNNALIHNYFIVGSNPGRDDQDKSNW